MNYLNKYLHFFAIVLILIFTLNLTARAKEVDYEIVKKVALNAFMLNSGISKSHLKITETIPISKNNKLVYYIFNFEKGHIVIANYDKVMPVLGYGLTSNIDFNRIPSGLLYLLDNYKDEILFAQKQKLQANKEINEKWNYYLNLDEQTAQKSYTPGTYLLTTTWGQGAGYKQYCPDKPNSSIKCSVGCGGVALGQILKYWNCRVFPDGSNTYTSSAINQSLSVNYYNQDYYWQNMSINSPDDDNALLLYHSAVALSSNFCSNGTNTSSSTYNAYNAFVNYFGFHAYPPKFKNDYLLNDTWINMLKTEINAKRPIYYRGEGQGGGHAWVIDGYRNDNTFHCNWGWDGSYIENWYILSALNEGGYQFNDYQGAILNIYPLLDACSGIPGSNVICTSNTSYSVSIPSSASVLWSKSSNLTQSGGNTGTTYTVHAANSYQNGNGFVKATIKNSQGQIFITRSNDMWVGKPYAPTSIMFMPYSPYVGGQSVDAFVSSNNPHQANVTYQWDGGPHNLNPESIDWSSVSFKTINTQYWYSTIFRVSASNTCGTSLEYSKLLTVKEQPNGGGEIPERGGNAAAKHLSISPNPASNNIKVTESIPIGDDQPWELRLINTQGFVVYNTSTRLPKTIKINELQLGVYILHAKKGNQVEQHRLSVK